MELYHVFWNDGSRDYGGYVYGESREEVEKRLSCALKTNNANCSLLSVRKASKHKLSSNDMVIL